MKKKLLIFVFLVLLSLTLAGCDIEEDVWTPFVNLFDTYLSDFTCYVANIAIKLLQYILDGFCDIITPLVSTFPEMELPSLSLASVPAIEYIAFFIPISEAATLLSAFLSFYMTFWLVRWLLRWLKLWK